MKNKIPSEGLRLGRDSGSILCDTLKKVAFSDSLGGGKPLSVRQIARHQLVVDMIIQYFHNVFCSYFFLQKYNFFGKSARKSA